MQEGNKYTVFLLDDSRNCQPVVVSKQSLHMYWQEAYSKHRIVEASEIEMSGWNEHNLN